MSSNSASPRFISIHGIDGTGKSTLSEVLAEQLRIHGTESYTYDEYCRENSIINPFSQFKARVKERSIDNQYRFFLISAAFKSFIVQKATDEGVTIIADRWHTDIHAHHIHAGAKPLETPASILIPDVFIMLVTDEQVRQERIAQRLDNTADDLIPKLPGTRTTFFDNFIRDSLRQNDLSIDTGLYTPQDAAALIIERYFNPEDFARE